MKRRAKQPTVADIAQFSSPWTGLAAMILFQAVDDLYFLNGRDAARRNDSVVRRWEILNFLRSPWAEYLAESLHIPREALLEVKP